MTNRPGFSHLLVASGCHKFNLNLRSQRQIRHGKQTHPDIAEIDAKSIHLRRVCEYLDRGIQQLPLSTTPVVEVVFEYHLRGISEVQGSAMTLGGEDYGGPAPPIQDLNSIQLSSW